MTPPFLFDISGMDLELVTVDAAGIERINPHRGAMRMLDGIIHLSDDQTQVVAFKDVRSDEFWVAGHIPGRPLFPGVMMLEAAAQLASYVTLKRIGQQVFMGFVGADKVKFRRLVEPGDRLILLCRQVQFRRRRFVCDAQGLVNGHLVFEATITGMPV